LLSQFDGINLRDDIFAGDDKPLLRAPNFHVISRHVTEQRQSLVTIGAKKNAIMCSLVQFEPKWDLRKLHMAAHLCADPQPRGGFGSLHPLQSAKTLMKQG
jgi:hypothetical protein